MDFNRRKSFLSTISLFQALSDKDVDYLAQNVEEKFFSQGRIVFEEDEEADAMYVIGYGEIGIYKGKREVARLTSGDYIGEMAILDSGRRCALAKAMTNSFLFRIPQSLFHQIIGTKSESLFSILQTLNNRLRETGRKLEEDHLHLSTLIHDMKNALAIFSYAYLIKQQAPENPSINEFSDHILTAQQNLSSMMQNALNSYRNPSSSYAYDGRHLGDLVRSIVFSQIALHPDVQRHNIVFDCAENLQECPHNTNDMGRVIANLVINACQACAEKSEIKVRLSSKEDKMHLEVIDQGDGISDEVKEMIFIPRFTSKETGNGLGLSSVKSIVEKFHKGELSFESEIGKGTTFRVSLPLVQ